MDLLKNYLIIFIVPAIIAFIATPFAKKVAYHFGAIDVPKDNRRVHKKPIPRLGGLAIFIATMISIIIFEDLNKEIIGILIGGAIIAGIGIIDDIKPVEAKTKLFFQVLAAVVAYISGINIEIVSIPFIDGGYIGLQGYISFPLTILWIVGITNTINLIDGLDGLSAGISAIAGISMGIVGIMDGNFIAASLSLIIAGSAIGFLPYNFNPASIFMGDTGALFLGFILAAASIEGTVKSATAVAIVIPLLVLGVPIFDTFFAMLRRYRSGRPLMEADRGHVHHKLLDLGLGQKRTVLILYIVGAVFGISAIIMYKMSFIQSIILLIVVAVVVIVALNKLRELSRNIRNRE